ncbi:hypothetical protein J2X77_004051 [Sphingobacterium sp. 2149]|nr:hypothetical protein [Sphingobacterium sp. 2149]
MNPKKYSKADYLIEKNDEKINISRSPNQFL